LNKLVYIPYNSSLTEKARKLRKTPTPAEEKIWKGVLRGRNLMGLKFSRQKPLDEYIVDFYCSELLLAIEIDGDSHANQELYDDKRTQKLNSLGVTVLRYTNKEVMENIDGVYKDLKKRIKNLKQPPQSPLSGGS
ncbi:MAG: endonuclease domain-containing protein, partial [Nitrospinota bacterium]